MTTGAQASNELTSDFQTELGVTALPPGLTLGGVIVDFTFRRAATSTTTESGVHWGIIVIPSGDLTAPNPSTELHADWLWLETTYFDNDAATAHVGSSSDGLGPRRVKAMRRLDEIGMVPFLTAIPAVASETISAHFHLSSLLILP